MRLDEVSEAGWVHRCQRVGKSFFAGTTSLIFSALFQAPLLQEAFITTPAPPLLSKHVDVQGVRFRWRHPMQLPPIFIFVWARRTSIRVTAGQWPNSRRVQDIGAWGDRAVSHGRDHGIRYGELNNGKLTSAITIAIASAV